MITALIPVREGTDIEDIRQLLAGTRIHRAPVMAGGRLAASSAGVCPSRGTCWSSLCATPSVETHTRVQEWQQNDCVTLQITPISPLPIPITFWRGEAGDGGGGGGVRGAAGRPAAGAGCGPPGHVEDAEQRQPLAASLAASRLNRPPWDDWPDSREAASHGSPAVAGGRRLSVGNTRGSLLADRASSLVTGLPPLVCKSIAKASKVRILHLPPRA